MPNPAEASFVTWINTLAANGYTVTQGMATAFPACSNSGSNPYINYLGSCFGNNASTPYILVDPPAPSGQPNNLPAYTQNNFAQTPVGASPIPNNFYELANNEAIVTIITLPPTAAYYSLQTYMFERQDTSGYAIQPPTGSLCADGTICCPPGTFWPPQQSTYELTYDCKYDEFGYFTNAVNNIDILAQSGLQFNADPNNPVNAVAVVTTPNAALFANIQQYFNATPGLRPSWLFTEPMQAGGSSPLLKTGIDTKSDIFGTIIRYTLPQVKSAGATWSSDPQNNVLVYRIRAPSSITQTLYGFTALLPNSYNTDETANATSQCPAIGTAQSQSYYCDIQELAALLKGYLVAHGNTEPYALVNTSRAKVGGYGVTGQGCITNGSPCAGGTQDTDSYYNAPIGQLLTKGPAFVIGVNHSSSAGDPNPPASPVNNADYTGVSAAIQTYNQGVTDDTQPNATATFPPSSENPVLGTGLSGSAAAVVTAFDLAASPALTHDLPNLYVAVFYRGAPCKNLAYCLPGEPYITFIQSTDDKAANFIPQGANVLLTERGYLLPPATPATPAAPTSGASAAHTQPPYILFDMNG